jgi:two-component system chemotaxis response regulator CheB
MPRRDIVVVGASAGGVEALATALRADPPLEAAIFCAVHIAPGQPTALPAILQRRTGLPARLGEHLQPIEPGTITLAPPDHHMLVGHDRVKIVSGPREHSTRPAIDPLFRSAAAMYRSRVTGVVLSGMMDDGALGLAAVGRCHGVRVVQDPADAMFDSMPRSALAAAGADYVLPASEIASLLATLTNEEVPDVVNDGEWIDPVEFDPGQSRAEAEKGVLTRLTCPECNGALWEIVDGTVHYRCHVGHAFTPESLQVSHTEEVERALWAAMRALEDQAVILNRAAARLEGGSGATRSRNRLEERAATAAEHAEIVRRIVANGDS